MKILLRPNFKRQNVPQALREVVCKLLKLEAVPLLTDKDAQISSGIEGCVYGEAQALFEECDIIMSIGGDGTVLHAARDAVRADKPLIGVNAGKIGFLTQLEISETNAFAALVSGKYSISERMLLNAELELDGKMKTFTALNDIVVRREDTNHILDVMVRQEDKLILSQRADGLIFATPTGSTAYSLSAGGPLASPEMELLLLTAICPHAVFRCSLILSPERVYTVLESPGIEQYGFSVSVDGIFAGRVEGGQTVRVSKSDHSVKLIDLGLRDFYGNINDKLSWRR